MKTLPGTPRPYNHWKAENVSFLHLLLLVLVVNMDSLLSKSCQIYSIVSKVFLENLNRLIECCINQIPTIWLVLVNCQHWSVGIVSIFRLVLLFLAMDDILVGITVQAMFCLAFF